MEAKTLLLFFSQALDQPMVPPTASGSARNEPETKPFMYRNDPTLVGKPGTPVAHHVPGRDPIWVQAFNTHQFIGPGTANRPEKCIAIWSFAADAAFFIDHGYLRFNPTNVGEPWKFTDSPHEDPFPKKKGNTLYFV